MKLGTILFERLRHSPGVAAYVGSGTDARIYPQVAGEDQPTEFPYLTYIVAGGSSLQNLTGASGLAMPLIQINAWMDNYDSETLEELIEQVRLAIQGWTDQFAGVQGAFAREVARDLPFDAEAKAVGKFLMVELHLSEAKS